MLKFDKKILTIINMKIDYKNPIVSSFFSICIIFVLFMIILCLTKPLCIMEVPVNGKGKKINGYLLCNYSLLFATLIGIIVFLFKTTNIQTPKLSFSTYNQRSYKPVTYI